MSWKGLRHKGIEPLFPDEWNAVVDALDELYFYGPAFFGRDIVPLADAKQDIGKPDKRWREGWFVRMYITDEGYIAGKKILKDGDPITIADLYYDAVYKIKEAIDISETAQHIANIDNNFVTRIREAVNTSSPKVTITDLYYDAVYKIKEAIDMAEATGILSEIRDAMTKELVSLIGYKIAEWVYGLHDIFYPDLEVMEDGRVRVKIMVDRPTSVYMVWQPSGILQRIEALLNKGITLDPFSWFEFDFTVKQGDKVNVKTKDDCTVTVTVYNIALP